MWKIDRANPQQQAESPRMSLTWAALLDRHDREQEITDAMVIEACANMDAAQTYPFTAEVRGDC